MLFTNKFLIRPLTIIVKKLFGKIAIKIYGSIILIRSKFNLNTSARFNKILQNNNSIHASIIITSIIILIFNLAFSSKKTFAADDNSPKPALFYLLQSEADDDQALIIETFTGSPVVTDEEENYLRNLASMRVQQQLEMKSPENTDATPTDSLVQGGTALVQPNIAKTTKIKRQRTTIVYHTVQPGETVSTIAQAYDISVSTILWENNLNAYSLIRPGDKLAILPMSGISYTVKKGDNISNIAKQYDVEDNDILSANQIADASYLKVGQKIIIPGGTKRYTAPTTTAYSGLSALKNIVTPPSAKAVSGNKMNWPTVGHRITQYYNWNHHAVDIANKIGTPIYAADAGVVEFAGWGTGYGNQIVINHGGGKKTRYAHASKLYVKKGDKVAKGETIAAMGSTGWSTGPHLHFEVIINNVKYNPLDYIQ